MTREIAMSNDALQSAINAAQEITNKNLSDQIGKLEEKVDSNTATLNYIKGKLEAGEKSNDRLFGVRSSIMMIVITAVVSYVISLLTGKHSG